MQSEGQPPSQDSALPQGWQWAPNEGEETRCLLDSIKATKDDPVARARVLDEARDILARCPPPNGTIARSETGLAIGYVQSGKTMSFTTVAALARDNGYRIVIVVTGISTSLSKQSRERLVGDLRLADRSDRPWLHLSEEKPGSWANRALLVRNTLEAWRDPAGLPHDRRTVLVTVMKHHGHLASVTSLLRAVGREFLRDAPTLIIDDEADQAGLNTLVQKNNQSTTYRRLLELKQELPIHSYIQYTATPQATLLINIIDILSPRFATLLTPGDAYVGGSSFFKDVPRLYRNIPVAEIPQRNQPLPGPPDSLLDALRVFLLGVAAGDVLDQGKDNRTMLVHPTHLRDGHTVYADWVEEIKLQWSNVLSLPESDPDRQELLSEFQDCYRDLSRTVDSSLPSFDVLSVRLLQAIRGTDVQVVNAKTGATPKIDWKSNYSFILVGGQAMDRGFTVEGLTVTYMPRGIGDGNADTVQQRARFLGYKRHYRGYCRVYLDSQTRDAFEEYVTHEEDLRAQLRKHSTDGKTLREWRRAFLLTSMLRPTRKEVLGVPYVREAVEEHTPIWIRQPHHSRDAMAENQRIIDGFIGAHQSEFGEFPGSSLRTPPQRPRVANLDLRLLFEKLLTPLQFSFLEDSQRFTAALLVIEWYMRQYKDSPLRAALIEMGTDPKTHVRTRGLNEFGSIKNPFQGEAPVEPKSQRGTVYPGDQAIRLRDVLSVQIHRLRLTDEGTGATVVPFVYTLAIFLPAGVEESVVLQPQGG